MKVYVDKLPETCIECPFFIGITCRCKLLHEYLYECVERVPEQCPIHSLSDYTKQARKKEREKIKKLEQQLKSQPKEIVEKINSEIYTRMVVECKETKYTDINLILNNILKEYQK